MWRSFFLAVGVSLMVLGGEALIFEKVEIADSVTIPKAFDSLMEGGSADRFSLNSPSPQPTAPFNNGGSAGRFDNAGETPFNPSRFTQSRFGQSQFTQSQFGPSRFSGPQSGGYGGGRVDLSRSGLTANPNQGLNTGAFPVSFANAGSTDGGRVAASPNSRTGKRSIVVKDWMPWSLLAAGAIIFLYTSSHRGFRES